MREIQLSLLDKIKLFYKGIFSKVYTKKSPKSKSLLINVLTRTSGRPQGFNKCYKSIKNQTYTNFNHIVSYDSDEDLQYLQNYDVQKVKVNRKEIDEVAHHFNPGNREFSPHNLYCNKLLELVDQGWIMFLDDDDMLLHDQVFEELTNTIENINSNTLIFWQMRYPDGKVLPEDSLMKSRKIALYHIGSPCFLFHSKYALEAKWDPWKCGDYRYIEKLYRKIPFKKWIHKPFIQINNFGDYGNRNDID